MSELFLSHNQKDRAWVGALYSELLRLGVNDIFRDEYASDPGQRLLPALQRGLAGTRMLVLVWSAGADSPRWVESGLSNLLAGIAARVVPVRLDDAPLPGFLRLFACEEARTEALPGGRPIAELAARIALSLEHARRSAGKAI